MHPITPVPLLVADGAPADVTGAPLLTRELAHWGVRIAPVSLQWPGSDHTSAVVVQQDRQVGDRALCSALQRGTLRGCSGLEERLRLSDCRIHEDRRRGVQIGGRGKHGRQTEWAADGAVTGVGAVNVKVTLLLLTTAAPHPLEVSGDARPR